MNWKIICDTLKKCQMLVDWKKKGKNLVEKKERKDNTETFLKMSSFMIHRKMYLYSLKLHKVEKMTECLSVRELSI